jgi:hemolysin III
VDFHQPVASATHLFTAVWALFATLVMVRQSRNVERILKAAVLFLGFSMVVLYCASGLYHGLRFDSDADKTLWLRLDRSAIFLLILGSNLPMYAAYLSGWRLVLPTVVMSAIAVIGIAFQWVGTVTQGIAIGSYVGMSLVGALTLPWWARRVPAGGLRWFVLAMGLYAAGAAIEGLQWPNPLPDVLGHHELLHLFDTVGTLAHFTFVTRFVLRPVPSAGAPYDNATTANDPGLDPCFPAATTSAIT